MSAKGAAPDLDRMAGRIARRMSADDVWEALKRRLCEANHMKAHDTKGKALMDMRKGDGVAMSCKGGGICTRPRYKDGLTRGEREGKETFLLIRSFPLTTFVVQALSKRARIAYHYKNELGMPMIVSISEAEFLLCNSVVKA